MDAIDVSHISILQIWTRPALTGSAPLAREKKGFFISFFPQSNYHKALDAGESPTTIVDMARGALFHQSNGNNELRLP